MTLSIVSITCCVAEALQSFRFSQMPAVWWMQRKILEQIRLCRRHRTYLHHKHRISLNKEHGTGSDILLSAQSWSDVGPLWVTLFLNFSVVSHATLLSFSRKRGTKKCIRCANLNNRWCSRSKSDTDPAGKATFIARPCPKNSLQGASSICSRTPRRWGQQFNRCTFSKFDVDVCQ